MKFLLFQGSSDVYLSAGVLVDRFKEFYINAYFVFKVSKVEFAQCPL